MVHISFWTTLLNAFTPWSCLNLYVSVYLLQVDYMLRVFSTKNAACVCHGYSVLKKNKHVWCSVQRVQLVYLCSRCSCFKLGCFSSLRWGRASGGWCSSPVNIAHQQPQGDDHIGHVSTDLLHHLSSSSSVSVRLSAARRPDWTRRCQEGETPVISAQKGLLVWYVRSCL